MSHGGNEAQIRRSRPGHDDICSLGRAITHQLALAQYFFRGFSQLLGSRLDGVEETKAQVSRGRVGLSVNYFPIEGHHAAIRESSPRVDVDNVLRRILCHFLNLVLMLILSPSVPPPLLSCHHGEGIGLALSGVTTTAPVGQSPSQLKQTIQSPG